MITTIPFKILDIQGEGFHLLLKIHINKKVANLLIDTGASKTVLDSNRIQKFVNHTNFEANDKLSTGLGTNTMQSHFTTIDKIKIGAIEIKKYTAVLLDLSHVNNSYTQIGLPAIEGVLGSDILMEYKAVIDYEKRLLKLKYPKPKK